MARNMLFEGVKGRVLILTACARSGVNKCQADIKDILLLDAVLDARRIAPKHVALNTLG